MNKLYALIACLIAVLIATGSARAIAGLVSRHLQSFIIGALAAEFRRPFWASVKRRLWCLVRCSPRLVRMLGPFFLQGEFPQKLGPFAMEIVPHIGDLYSSERARDDESDEWVIRSSVCKEKLNIVSEVLCEDGTKRPAQQRIVLSRQHELTFGVGRRQKLGIPTNATGMRWAYAAREHSRLGKEVELKYESTHDDVLATVHFLDVGGFMYFSADGQLLQVMTPVFAADGRQDTICFDKPKNLTREWTAELHRQRRFHKVTVPEFKARGAKYFCWLKPGERFAAGPDEASLLPHGGFAYIFHEPEVDDLLPWPKSDCYFAVSSLQTFKTKRKLT